MKLEDNVEVLKSKLALEIQGKYVETVRAIIESDASNEEKHTCLMTSMIALMNYTLGMAGDAGTLSMTADTFRRYLEDALISIAKKKGWY